MANLNFDFESFADLDEALEAAALEILESTPAEIIHISDAELEQMANQILIKEEKVAKTWKLSKKIASIVLLSSTLLGSLAFGHSKLREYVATLPCTPTADDVCEIPSQPQCYPTTEDGCVIPNPKQLDPGKDANGNYPNWY